MPQVIDATIDSVGHVILREKVRLNGVHNARVTILDEVKSEETGEQEWSLFGSVEIIDDDLESASREISDALNGSIERSGKEVNPPIK